MKLDDLNLFRLIVEHGSYTLASKKTGIPVATLTRRIQALEEDIQIRLLHRDARKLSVTEAGQAFFERCKPLLEQLIDTADDLTESCKGTSGVLRISAPSNIAMKLLQPMFTAFLKKYPDIRLDLALSNDVDQQNNDDRHAFIRIGPQRDSSLIARKLHSVRDILVASPCYLKNRPPLRDAGDLPHHDLLKGWPLMRWRLNDDKGQQLCVSQQGRFEASELRVIRVAAKDGLGVALIPDVLVQQDLESGDLEHVLKDWTSNPRDIYLMYRDKTHQPEKLRAFIEFSLSFFQSRTSKS
ncbi:LysR family transcriptional regulator [Enterovibrio nigricans]|uniref:LysR family transcriptional regulator, transcriptional activator AphB n=1 Tax=Enterovibrio nigricans DSM 22720 TaxID=1121868 RepID=A0A1T4U8B0_9GAMM|nr:LysR family transcriptional regulator [Enterovibrio nigricans]PKF51774.1 LysR family transcriptional regulator [Enterovibrio nigricans]SKA48751.1 LysR family transcriptional regulator, transcriptional activator AphB [Enterovibrio nigricans DSM 22720]